MKKLLIAIFVFTLLIGANTCFAKSTEAMKEDGDLLVILIGAVLGGALLLGNVLVLTIGATEKKVKSNKQKNYRTNTNRKKSRRRLKPVDVNYKMPQPAPNYAMRRRTNQNIAY